MLQDLIIKNYKNFSGESLDHGKIIGDEIEKLNAKIAKARDLLLAEKIDADDYRDTKIVCKEKIDALEEKLARYTAERSVIDVKTTLNKALNVLEGISKIYSEGNIELKRSIIGSIYPEKVEFDGSTYRTQRVNVFASHIFQINNELRAKKKQESRRIF